MDGFQLLLVIATLLAILLGSCIADVRFIDPSIDGLFYLFMSGQIVVLDPKTKTFIAKFNQTESGNAAPFPNACPGHPLQGTWNAVTTGIAGQTIFATASFVQPPSQRPSSLSDGVVVVDTENKALGPIIAVPDVPNDVKFVPTQGSVWAHADNTGTFAVLSATPPYSTLHKQLGSANVIPGYGRLVAHSGLGFHAFKTNAQMSGLFRLSLQSYTNAPIPFINANKCDIPRHDWLPPPPVVHCTGTADAVFVPTSCRLFIACSKAGSPPPTGGPIPGIVEMTVDDYKVLNYWQFQADRLYLTPDESFVLAVDSASATINVIQPSPIPTQGEIPQLAFQWPAIQLPEGSHPDRLDFYPSGSYYLILVSLINSKSTAMIDLNILLQCGPVCGDTSQAVTLLPSGNQVPPSGSSLSLGASASKRPMAVGSHFMCVTAAFDRSLHCHDLTQPKNTHVYPGLFDIQEMIFVETAHNDTLPGSPVDVSFDCATAPTTV